MTNFTVVDAMMGRGKTTAATRYMREHEDTDRFLYVCPYLDEVARVCTTCGYDKPEDNKDSKLHSLKGLMMQEKNVAITHQLFQYFDTQVLSLIVQKRYSLIIDEQIDVVERLKYPKSDVQLVMQHLAIADQSGLVHWANEDYRQASFSNLRRMTENETLFFFNDSFVRVYNPSVFLRFKDVFVLTYLFEGSVLSGYFKLCNFNYKVVGIEEDSEGVKFSDKPDSPPPTDFDSLINIIGGDDGTPERDRVLNEIGEEKNSLTYTWYKCRPSSDRKLRQVYNNLRTFYERCVPVPASQRLWTCFKAPAERMLSKKRRFVTAFAPVNIRSTNKYRQATAVAYLANRCIDPFLVKFFRVRGVSVNSDVYALSEMLQFIWRSAIRDGKPITLYVPSSRMRDLLQEWIYVVSTGGQYYL